MRKKLNATGIIKTKDFTFVFLSEWSGILIPKSLNTEEANAWIEADKPHLYDIHIRDILEDLILAAGGEPDYSGV